MLRKSILFLAVLSLTGLSACSKSEKTSAESDNLFENMTCDNSGSDASSELSGIVRGHKLGQNNPVSSRIVSLYFQQGDMGGICTGALLPNHVVLTAAHCMPSSMNPKDIHVIFNNSLGCVKKSNMQNFVRSVKTLRRHADYSGEAKDTDHDIAMLRFEGELPQGFQTFDVPNEPVTLNYSDKLIFAGYGVTNATASDAATLRITSLPASKLSQKSSSDKGFTLDQRDTGVCSGDSGGPMMVNKGGTLKIVGIASAVSNPYAPKSELCSKYGYFLDVSSSLEWIRDNYNQLVYQ